MLFLRFFVFRRLHHGRRSRAATEDDDAVRKPRMTVSPRKLYYSSKCWFTGLVTGFRSCISTRCDVFSLRFLTGMTLKCGTVAQRVDDFSPD
jgi:hypothetical protein